MKYLTDMQFWIAWLIAAVVIGLVLRTVLK
jgi:hypothetical protein